MEAPLLGGSKTVVAVDYTPPTSVAEVAKVFKIETVRLWKIAAPLVFLSLCNYGTNTVTTIFVGHLGELELSAVSIALSVINTFAYGFLLGMGSALETLCGQAFGAGQIHMLGIFMQRSWIILLLGCLAILPIYIFATPILKLLGQDDDIAELAGQFTILTIPNLISLAICFPAQKFLQAQTKVRVLAWIGLLALVGHCFLLWLFIHVLGWGVSGAGIAFNFSRWVIVIAQLIYIFGWCKDAWTGFSWAAFTDLWAFLKLSVASAVMLCLEVWYMMSIPLLTGGLDDAVIAVGSLSICTNLNGIVAMIFLGLEAAISLAGHEAEMEESEQERRFDRLSMKIGGRNVERSSQPVGRQPVSRLGLPQHLAPRKKGRIYKELPAGQATRSGSAGWEHTKKNFQTYWELPAG